MDFVDSVKNESAYYVFAARHIEYDTGDLPVPTPTDDYANNTINIYDNMIFGKRVTPSDVINMIPRNEWVSNTSYTMYDDTDSLLYNKQFFASVNTGSSFDVYKCIYSNGYSTVAPSGTDLNVFETSDGYMWKYMYTAPSSLMSKFSTTTHIPVSPNTSVIEAAADGSIEAIKILESGQGYDNYLTGTFSSATDIKVGGSPYQYSIGANASTLNNFYNGCIMLITSGAAMGEYSIISNYQIVGSQRVATISSIFNNNIAVNDTFEIYPYVYVFDTGGRKQTNCIARAIVSNTSGNSISKIEIIDPGTGYRSATAVIIPDATVNVKTSCTMRPIISPYGGHGHDVISELGGNYAAIAVDFTGNEEALHTENDYRQVGLIKDPLFANVNIKINTSKTKGAFAVGENVFQYRDIKLTGTVTVNSSAIVTGSNTYFTDAIKTGDRVLITDGISNHFTNVISVPSNTQIQVASNTTFSNSACSISLVNAVSYGVCTATSTGEIYVSYSSTAGLTDSLKIVGEESHCTSVVNTAAALPVAVNGRAPNNFNTFTQLTMFAGVLQAGSFITDETVTQDSAITYAEPNAKVYSITDTGSTDYLYLTNVRNTFQTSGSPDSDGIVVGANSQATFVVSAKYDGDLIPDSGDILYIENLSPISRSNSQSETVKLILSF